MTPLRVFIGYDNRERTAWQVCRSSIERRCSQPTIITPLMRSRLERAGIFWRTSFVDDDGHRIDNTDGRPFSTDFAFTRFLVPTLAQWDGWALFCDSDFLFTADLAGLFEHADRRFAVQVVKHTHVPRETSKMDGQAQQPYRRKNWSSLVLWNCAHPHNLLLTPKVVNSKAGSFLHAFDWLADELIGDLPATWNHLVGVDPSTTELPCGIHFTLGVPDMPGYEKCDYAPAWHAERRSRRAPGDRPTQSEFLRARD